MEVLKKIVRYNAPTYALAGTPGERRAVAEHIAGGVDWINETSGHCRCPGRIRPLRPHGEAGLYHIYRLQSQFSLLPP